MAHPDIELLGAVYPTVPAVKLPIYGGGMAQFDDTTDADATAADIANGKTAYVNGVKLTGTGSGGGGIIIEDTPDPAGGTIREITAIAISGTYTASANTTGVDVSGYHYLDVNVPPVGYDVPTFTGTFDGVDLVFTCDKSFAECKSLADYGLTAALVIAIGATAYNVIEKDASHITYEFIEPWEVYHLTYYSNGTIEWNSDVVPQRTSGNLTVSGATVNVPAGMYESAASATVASGTEGTPTATKGAVSNHAVTVTPTVTNTAGYINGGTKTGTGVQVTAAELVSGSETKTQNGTYDVTNLAELVVNVSGGKNAQIANGFNRVAATAYTAVTGQSITVSKSGTYDVYWVGYRSSTSGTNGSQLYIGNTAYGTASTSFDATYTNWQMVHLSGVSLTENQTITVRARSRGTSYYMYIANLTIIES